MHSLSPLGDGRADLAVHLSFLLFDVRKEDAVELVLQGANPLVAATHSLIGVGAGTVSNRRLD